MTAELPVGLVVESFSWKGLLQGDVMSKTGVLFGGYICTGGYATGINWWVIRDKRKSHQVKYSDFV